jgi:Ca2+-transporting ATPase
MKKEQELKGLSSSRVARHLERDGFNELPSQKPVGAWAILFRILSEPMLFLLLLGAAAYFLIGETQDAWLLALSALVVIGITFFQERKTENALAVLRDLSSPKALVIRDGEKIKISSRELVSGDLVIVSEGDRLPADGVVLSGENILVDESLLTGESILVSKIALPYEDWEKEFKIERPGGDNQPFVYSGTLLVGGRAIIKVLATGVKTEIGRIGQSLESIKDEDTLLHKEISRIVKLFFLIGLAFFILIVFFYAFLKDDLLGGFLSGITLSMAMMPEEFPVVLTIFLTFGAWKISRHKVLARRSAAIETLGAASVLCTDKTGTLTLNKMELSSLYAGSSFYELSDYASTDLSERYRELLENSVFASQESSSDPMEKEILRMSKLYLPDIENKLEAVSPLKEYPISRQLTAFIKAYRHESGRGTFLAAKGSPEAIADLCHFDDKAKEDILLRVKEMSEKGLRVLGVAKTFSPSNELADKPTGYDFNFLGLLGFVDPLRSTAPRAVKEAYGAGMRVIIITGDYQGTAENIALQAGLDNPGVSLTGRDLERLSPKELQEKIKTVNVFARVAPEQKLMIVEALKANGQIVAMTGDGVNDTPALKAAHIGIAMGGRGTDVAREAASLILLNDDFSSIVVAVRLGRRIYENLKRAMEYIIAVHIPTVGMAVLPLFFGFPPVLLPAHIAFLELIIDPACSLAFESQKESRGLMKRPPRRLDQPLFDFSMLFFGFFQGLSALVIAFILFIYSNWQAHGEDYSRALAFSSLVISNLILIIANLSWGKPLLESCKNAGRTVCLIIGGASVFLLAVIYVPYLSSLFHLSPLALRDVFLVFAVNLFGLSWLFWPWKDKKFGK